jgi:hypothetical protein
LPADGRVFRHLAGPEHLPDRHVEGLVADAVKEGIWLDAIKQFILLCIKRRPPRLDVTAYPYLPKANVGLTRTANYAALVPGEPHERGDAGKDAGQVLTYSIIFLRRRRRRLW